MLRLLLVFALFSFAFPFTSSPLAQGASTDIFYLVKPLLPHSAALQVSFQYRSNAAGKLILRFENNSWGDRDLFNCLTGLTVSPAPQSIEMLPDSSLIKIIAQPNQELQVRYAIRQDFNVTLKNVHRYRPIVQKEYFHVLGMRLFLVPENLFQSDSDSARIEINWAAPAAGHIFHSNFGPGLRQKANLTKDMLYSTFFIGGDFRRYSYSWKNQTIYLVTRGNWSSFTDQQVLDILKATIPAQMDFWKDRLDAPFSVSLLPTFEEWTDSSKSYSLGGSGLLNSFISFSSNNPGTELKMLRWLYNHELLHRWIGQTLVNEEEEKQYWFSEGFTDYYAYKLMLRNNQISLEDFLDVINKEVLAPHYQSPVRTLPNSELTQQKFWSDRQYNKLPYRRGLLYALLLDSQIKKKYHGKKSLDNLMKNLMAQAKKSGDFKFNHTVFQDQLDTYLGSAAITEFGRYILHGNLINFEESLPAGLLLETQKDIPAIIISPLANKKKLADLLGK